MQLLKEAVKIDTEIFISIDDYADKNSTMMSLKHFEKFILPGLTKIVEKAHKFDAKYIKHTCGNINDIFDMLLSSGIDGLHPIDSSVGMNIFDVKKNYGEKVCLVSNVDCIDALYTGTKQQVIDEVKELIKRVEYNRGFMLASINSIHSGVKPEDFLIMVEAAKKYSDYSKSIVK